MGSSFVPNFREAICSLSLGMSTEMPQSSPSIGVRMSSPEVLKKLILEEGDDSIVLVAVTEMSNLPMAPRELNGRQIAELL